MGSADDENGRNRKEVEEKRIKKGGERDTGGEIKTPMRVESKRERDIDGKKGKFLSAELYTRARGVAQSRAAGSELLNAVFCSKARSAAVSDVSAEGAKMVGVGRGMSQQSFESHIHGEGLPLLK